LLFAALAFVTSIRACLIAPDLVSDSAAFSTANVIFALEALVITRFYEE